MQKLPSCGVVFGPELAIQIGDLLCEEFYGDSALQRPLFAVDMGEFWRVEGNRNRDGKIDGLAEFFLSVKKADGRVTDLGELMRYHPHPSVAPIIKEHQRKQAERNLAAGGEWANAVGSTQSRESESRTGMLFLTKLARGGVVFSSRLAGKIGELLCNAHYGDRAWREPFTAADKGMYWRVESGAKKDEKAGVTRAFFASIEKYDGRVTEMGES